MRFWFLITIFSIAAPLFAAALILALRAFLNRFVDRRIASYQNDLVAKHCEEVQNIYRQM